MQVNVLTTTKKLLLISLNVQGTGFGNACQPVAHADHSGFRNEGAAKTLLKQALATLAGGGNCLTGAWPAASTFVHKSLHPALA